MEEKYMNTEINPGEDFFKYANEHWIDYNKQPAEYPRWGTFIVLRDENIKRVGKLIQKGDGSLISQKITQYYNLVLDWDKRNADGKKPLVDYLEKNIYAIKSKEELYDFCAHEHINPFWSLSIDADIKDNNANNLIWLCQTGLSLGNREYYVSKDKDKKDIVKAWKKYCKSMYEYLGLSKEDAKAKMQTIWNIEKKYAKVCYTKEEEQDPEKIYHKKDVAKLSKKLSFDFNEYLKLYGYDNTPIIIVEQEKALKLTVKFMHELPLDDLKTLLEWELLNTAPLDETVRKIRFKFTKKRTGQKKLTPKKKAAIQAVDGMFGEAIGQLYVRKYFSEEAKQDMIDLIKEQIISFKNIICEQEWMSEETKRLALEKLNNLRLKVGYPDKIEDYSDIPIDPSLSLFDNRRNIGKYFFKKNKEKHYNKPIDRDEWCMNPQDVNAYYHPILNEICFPAGILQAPFYDVKRSKPENYGGIGVVIGHEMTHGYDNNGRKFDIAGNMKMWWKDDEITKFTELTQNTVNHFNSLEAIPGIKADGSLTLGENLADYGGLRIAYNACKNVMGDELNSWTKAFFISFAQVWAGVSTDEFIKQQVLNDVHSVNTLRVNGTLPMFTPWYDAFNIKEDDKLYVKPEDRAKIW